MHISMMTNGSFGHFQGLWFHVLTAGKFSCFWGGEVVRDIFELTISITKKIGISL